MSDIHVVGDPNHLVDGRPDTLDPLLPEGWIAPRFDGDGVANVPSTIARLVGTDIGDLPPLARPLWEHLGDGLERVVMLVVDALGFRTLHRLIDGDPQTSEWFSAREARLAPLTAVFPSTTAVTMATLWTGRAPVQHGMLGYRMWLRDQGMVVNMLRLTGARDPHRGIDLIRDGAISTKRFLPGLTLAQQLNREGVQLRVLLPSRIQRGGLTRMLYRGSERVTGYASLGDSMVRLREEITGHAGRRVIISAYWDAFDHIGHARGPDDPAWDAQWRLLFDALRREVFDRLDDAARKATAVVVVADHGMARTTEAEVVTLTKHRRLRDMLAGPLSGEPRAPYLHVRPGAVDDVLDYVTMELADRFHAVRSEDALGAGLWGSGRVHREVHHRIGDIVLVGRNGATMRSGRRTFRTIGRHGGLTPDEAIVPWLAWRL